MPYFNCLEKADAIWDIIIDRLVVGKRKDIKAVQQVKVSSKVSVVEVRVKSIEVSQVAAVDEVDISIAQVENLPAVSQPVEVSLPSS